MIARQRPRDVESRAPPPFKPKVIEATPSLIRSSTGDWKRYSQMLVERLRSEQKLSVTKAKLLIERTVNALAKRERVMKKQNFKALIENMIF